MTSVIFNDPSGSGNSTKASNGTQSKGGGGGYDGSNGIGGDGGSGIIILRFPSF